MHMIAGPIAEMHMKLMISVSPDSYISPCLKKAPNSLSMSFELEKSIFSIKIILGSEFSFS